MFDSTSVSTLERIEENPTREITDDDMTVMLDALDVDQEATAKRVFFSSKLHYLLAQLVKESARLVVRQNVESNGFETWRRLYNRFVLPDATRATSLLTQLLDFRFNPATFEQDFNTWETLKVKYERQTGAELPEGVLVATLLHKTSGALQQHLRLNARTLQTYQQTHDTIVEYFRSKLILTSANSSSHEGGPAPMDIGFLGKGKGKKGKGKGKKGKGKGPHWSFFGTLKGKSKGKGKGKAQGKGKGKDFGSLNASASAKTGSSSSSALSSAVWTCGRRGHFANKCPLNRVSVLEKTEEEEQLYVDEEGVGGNSWEDWTVGVLSDDWSWFGDSWDSWEDFSWDWWPSSDFGWSEWPQETWQAPQETFPATTQENSKDATLPKAAPVSAVTVGEPPGLPRPKARPKAKSTLSPSSAVLSAVILSNFGLGSSFATDDMMTGRVDLRLGFEPPTVMHEPQAFVPAAIAPLQVFGTGEDPFEPPQLSQSHELFCVEDLDLPGLNTTFKDTFLEEHLLVSSISNHDDWILFDSGAATHCCPKDFASDCPLLPLTDRAPPLRSISGQPLTVFGRRIVKMNFDGQDSFLHFYVCDVPYCVVSVGRLLRQGYSVQLSSEEHSLVNPEGCRIPVERHGSLLFLRPSLLPFNQPEFEQMCNLLKDPCTSGTLVAHTAPQYSHTDKWELSGNTLTRTHKRSRATFSFLLTVPRTVQ